MKEWTIYFRVKNGIAIRSRGFEVESVAKQFSAHIIKKGGQLEGLKRAGKNVTQRFLLQFHRLALKGPSES